MEVVSPSFIYITDTEESAYSERSLMVHLWWLQINNDWFLNGLESTCLVSI